MWITAATFKLIAQQSGATPRRNAKNRFDKRSYVTAVVEALFPEELEAEQERLIELHCNMKPSTQLPWKSTRRGADDPDLYAALAAMSEEGRQQFEGLWRQAGEAEHDRQQNAWRQRAASPPVEGRASDANTDQLTAGPAMSTEDLGQGENDHAPHQRTDHRTPAVLRSLLLGLMGDAPIGFGHLFGGFAWPQSESGLLEPMAYSSNCLCYNVGGDATVCAQMCKGRDKHHT